MTKLMNPVAIVAQADLKKLAARINDEHAACEKALEQSVLHALSAGRALLEAKASAGHGNWLPWLKENVAFTERTAQTYMRLAIGWPTIEANTKRAAYLSIREALSLLGPEEDEPADNTPTPAAPAEDTGPILFGIPLGVTRLAPIDSIRADGDTHARAPVDPPYARHGSASVDSRYVNLYAIRYRLAIKRGREHPCDALPALDCVFDGETRWLFDGHIRYHAMRQAGVTVCRVVDRTGTLEDAKWFACAGDMPIDALDDYDAESLFSEARMAACPTITLGWREFRGVFAGLLPPIEGEQWESFVASVHSQGVAVPIRVDEDDNVLDGWMRVCAAAELGLDDIPIVVETGLSVQDKFTLCKSLNLFRCHGRKRTPSAVPA